MEYLSIDRGQRSYEGDKACYSIVGGPLSCDRTQLFENPVLAVGYYGMDTVLNNYIGEIATTGTTTLSQADKTKLKDLSFAIYAAEPISMIGHVQIQLKHMEEFTIKPYFYSYIEYVYGLGDTKEMERIEAKLASGAWAWRDVVSDDGFAIVGPSKELYNTSTNLPIGRGAAKDEPYIHTITLERIK